MLCVLYISQSKSRDKEPVNAFEDILDRKSEGGYESIVGSSDGDGAASPETV